MKIKLEGTIPTTAYGNLRPTFEVENEEELELAHKAMMSIWNRFGESPLKDKQGGGVEVKTFTGETIIWNEDTHRYTDTSGNILMSASQYADANSPRFDMENILPKTAKSWEVDESDLKEIWSMNSNISTSYGSAIHKALELYHRYHKIGAAISKKRGDELNYVLPKNEHIRNLVLNFVELAGTEALSEVVVSDVANLMAGTIDRLVITGEKSCRIGDYKTNNDLDSKKIKKYQLQLSFYAKILANKGWSIDGLDIFYIDNSGNWKKETVEVVEIA